MPTPVRMDRPNVAGFGDEGLGQLNGRSVRPTGPVRYRMSEPKWHHTIPRRYQAGFAHVADGPLWRFERSKQRIRRANPENTAVRKHFYRWERPGSVKPTAIETFLADSVENPAWPVLDKLDRREIPTQLDRMRLSFFCAFLLVRVPAFRASFEFAFAATVARHADLARDAAPLDELFQTTASGILIPRASKDRLLAKMIDIGMKVGRYLMTLEMHLLFSDSREPFITTDNPFGLVRIVDHGQEKGVMVPGFLKVIPLSARTAVGFAEAGDTIWATDVSAEKMRRNNRKLAAQATEFVIAGSEEQLRALVHDLPAEAPHPSTFPTELS